MAGLRRRLSPDGNVVSEAGRRRTIEVFGEPLTPVGCPTDLPRREDHGACRRCWTIRPALTERSFRPKRSACLRRDSAAHAQADRRFLEAIRSIRERIASFQEAILHEDVRVDVPGGYLIERYRPLDRVGICVPGGAAAYPSTVLMTAVPAGGGRQGTGPGRPAHEVRGLQSGHPGHLLRAGNRRGLPSRRRQGVAALAYGVEGLRRVDKIVGPGNLFVALAKKHVYGEVDIDSIAGPSEVVVIVDRSARADYTALDLIAQAEQRLGRAS